MIDLKGKNLLQVKTLIKKTLEDLLHQLFFDNDMKLLIGLIPK